MTRRDVVIAALGFVSAVLIIAMLFVTVLGVLGRGIMGGLMQNTSGVMFFVMVSFPIYAVLLMAALFWWIFKREGG